MSSFGDLLCEMYLALRPEEEIQIKNFSFIEQMQNSKRDLCDWHWKQFRETLMSSGWAKMFKLLLIYLLSLSPPVDLSVNLFHLPSNPKSCKYYVFIKILMVTWLSIQSRLKRLWWLIYFCFAIDFWSLRVCREFNFADLNPLQ